MATDTCLPFKCTHMVKVVTKVDSLKAYNSSLEGTTKLKLAPFCSSWDALSDGILFSKPFLDSENQNHGL